MSKHKPAEAKLHMNPATRRSLNAKRLAPSAQNQISPLPPKGTNANNQFR